MKKFISLKIFSLFLIIGASLISCRQDDDNDFKVAEKGILNTKTANKSESKITGNSGLEQEDPPVRNGTHWKNTK